VNGSRYPPRYQLPPGPQILGTGNVHSSTDPAHPSVAHSAHFDSYHISAARDNVSIHWYVNTYVCVSCEDSGVNCCVTVHVCVCVCHCTYTLCTTCHSTMTVCTSYNVCVQFHTVYVWVSHLQCVSLCVWNSHPFSFWWERVLELIDWLSW